MIIEETMRNFKYENGRLKEFLGELAELESECIHRNIAIQALEKQIPRIPINQFDMMGLKMGQCPACMVGNSIQTDKYCQRCGQRLDWEQEKKIKQINEQLLSEIERVLNIKFHDWQCNYLLDKPTLLDMKITGRCTGKTLVFIIKKLYEKDEPLYLTTRNEMLNECDWWCIGRYAEEAKRHGSYDMFFRDELRTIYKKLNEKGLTTRDVLFDKGTGND